MTHPRLRRTRITPALQALESRDVPATFYVDPLFTGLGNGTGVTFNSDILADGPNAVTGRTVGTDAFATLTAALAAAGANAEADTIFLARSRFDFDGGAITGNDLVPNVTQVDNTGGAIVINDSITLIGAGAGATVLGASADTADGFTGVIEVAAGRSLTVRDLTLAGNGFQVGAGFRFDGVGTTGTFERVEITGVAFAPIDGVGIAVYDGATVTVTDSKISGYGRVGVEFFNGSGAVTGSTITGVGPGTGFINYGIQLLGNAHVVITGNTITANTASTADPFLSAGVNLFEDAGAAPTATLTKNTITGNTFGVRVGGNRGVDRALASLHDNNLQSNYLAIQADNSTDVDATGNFFGSASGPYQSTTNKGGTGSEVTDQVIFAPFRTAAFVETTTVTVPGPVVTVPGPVVTVPGPVVTVPAPTPPPATPTPPVGFGVGGAGNAQVLNGSFVSTLGARPFGSFAGEVRVARADVTGDGTADLIVAAGPGGGPHVKVIDGVTGAVVRDFFAYRADFTGGVFVGGGDVNNDGFADILTGAGAGGQSHVKAFDGRTGALIHSFYAYVAHFTGGVTVAGGDINGDGFDDIVTGAGTTGGSHVEVFNGRNLGLLRSIYAYDKNFTGGVFVAAGDINGDGFVDVITGAGVGGGSNVRVFDGQTGTLPFSFYAFPGTQNGVRVATENLDGDGKDDLVFGAGAGGDNRTGVTYAANLANGNSAPTAFSQPLFGSTAGLNVG